MSQKRATKMSNRGTCPVCGYRVRVRIDRNVVSSKRTCYKHYVYYYKQGRVCEGSKQICKEDLNK